MIQSQNEMILDSEEEWRDVKGFENKYQASSLGRIRSLTRKVNVKNGSRTMKGRILKLNPHNGYRMVMLGGNTSGKLVHRLVGEAFLDNPKNKPCINHINGVRDDNKVSNLEWCTYSENEIHSYKVLKKKPNPTNLGKTGIKSYDAKPVVMVNSQNEIVDFFGSASEAARRLNRQQGRISTNARGETKKCYGHKFHYISKTEYFELQEGKRFKKYWID